MRLKAAILILTLLASVAAAATTFKITLRLQYEKHLWVLRSPFQSGDQEFDSSGKPLKDPPTGQWRAYGPVFVHKFHIDSDRVRLEGARVAFGADRKMMPIGKPIQINIHLDHPLKSLAEAQEILSRIFFPATETSDYPRPTFVRPDQTILPDETIYVVQKGNRVKPPVSRYTPDPDFPWAAQRKKRDGYVTLSLVLDKTGVVSRVTLEKAGGLGFDESSVEKVKTWRFEPATLDGQAVAVKVSSDFAFHLF